MSKTTALYAISAALHKAEEFAEVKDWYSKNDFQKEFLEKFFPKDSESQYFTPEELESIASTSAEEINSFLKERGFDLELGPIPPYGFGTAGVMRVLVKWKKAGTKIKIFNKNRKEYPAAKLENIAIYEVKGWPNLVAEIECENKDKVYLTKAEKDYSGFWFLPEQLLEENNFLRKGFYEIKFPFVDLNQMVDISFLQNMALENQFQIEKAIQQTKFRMNHLGAKAESAAAFKYLRCCSQSPSLIFNEPFLIWMTRPGLSMPYFVGYITEDDWKDPGDL